VGTDNTPKVLHSDNEGYWTVNAYSDRERAQSLLNSHTDPVDAALELAAQQWDRLGKYARMHASKAAPNPQMAAQFQLIGIGADNRAEYLRKQIAKPGAPVEAAHG
jgi:hypothetical protein